MKDDRLYLHHIVERIERIESMTGGGRENFLNNVSLQDAVIRNLEVIGEAARRVSKSLMEQHAQVPWRMMIRLRDLLIHHYDRVIVTEVWEIIELDLPRLKSEIEAVILRADQSR